MTPAMKQRTRIDQLDDGEWLHALLSDIHQQVASHPSPQAVARIRKRLLAEIKTPARAAA